MFQFLFHFTARKVADKGIHKTLDKLPTKSSLYGDRTYMGYKVKDELFNKYNFLKTQSKKNNKYINNK